MSVRPQAEARKMRKVLPLIAGALMLSGCAAETAQLVPPEPDPGAEYQAADPWKTPDLSRAFTNRPRATSFAGDVRLIEPRYTNADLHRNFLSIAMRAEAADNIDGAGDIALAKWVTPIRYTLVSANPTDRAQIASVIARLRRLTGLDIAPASRRDIPNLELWFVPRSERDAIVAGLIGAKAIGPQVTRLVQRWRDTEYEKCLGLMATDPSRGSILNSVILIKNELSRRIRNACIVEEIVQSLGLMNDDRAAKPSIFNDDQRYLDLTSHDEYLLRILYDPRIRPGMRRRQVAPLSHQIINELRPVSRGGA